MTDDEDVIFLPPFPLPAKPAYGAACNGCGFCCHSEVCPVGVYVFDINPSAAPCPAIIYIDGKVRCGLMMAEEMGKMKTGIRSMLGAGRGCDARLESEVDLPSAWPETEGKAA